jgi:hypothetical protein
MNNVTDTAIHLHPPYTNQVAKPYGKIIQLSGVITMYAMAGCVTVGSNSEESYISV